MWKQPLRSKQDVFHVDVVLRSCFGTLFQVSVRRVHAAEPSVLTCSPHLVHVATHLLRLATSQAGVGVGFRPQCHPPTPRRQQIQVREPITPPPAAAPFTRNIRTPPLPHRVLPDLPQAGMRNSPITVRSDPPRRVNSPVRVPPPGLCAPAWDI